MLPDFFSVLLRENYRYFFFFFTSVSPGIMLVLPFSPVITFWESTEQAVITDRCFGFSSVCAVNIPFLIFPRAENLVYLMEAVVFFLFCYSPCVC